MHLRPIAIGFILFGLLAIGCTLDGVRRKFMEQPLWVTENWRTLLKGVIGWCAIGTLAILGGIVAMLV